MYYSANSSGQDIPSLPSLLLTRVTAKICYDWRSRATIASKVDPRQPLRGSKIQFPLFAAYFASCRFATIGNWPLRYSSCIYVGHFHDMICFSVLCWADRNKNRKLNVFFLLKLISCHMSLWIKTEDVVINVCDVINGKLHKLIHTNCDFFFISVHLHQNIYQSLTWINWKRTMSWSTNPRMIGTSTTGQQVLSCFSFFTTHVYHTVKTLSFLHIM